MLSFAIGQPKCFFTHLINDADHLFNRNLSAVTQVINQPYQMLFLAHLLNIVSLCLCAFFSTFIVLNLLNSNCNLLSPHDTSDFPSESNSLEQLSILTEFPSNWNDYFPRFVTTKQCLDLGSTEEYVSLKVLLLGVLDVYVRVF